MAYIAYTSSNSFTTPSFILHTVSVEPKLVKLPYKYCGMENYMDNKSVNCMLQMAIHKGTATVDSNMQSPRRTWSDVFDTNESVSCYSKFHMR